jgi:hypothetical protein
VIYETVSMSKDHHRSSTFLRCELHVPARFALNFQDFYEDFYGESQQSQTTLIVDGGPPSVFAWHFC